MALSAKPRVAAVSFGTLVSNIYDFLLLSREWRIYSIVLNISIMCYVFNVVRLKNLIFSLSLLSDGELLQGKMESRYF